MNRTLIPDQAHIDEIRKRLWSSREIGKAAVMVGAGFSRNARSIIPTGRRLPLLEDIAVEMFETLYPANSMSESERSRLKVRMTGGTAIMNLASEFEIVFGRQALDDLLIRSVSDDKYVPSEIHELLLGLPWSDVFTTNYDTLIERTRPRIRNRKYDVIYNSSNIPGSMKPRIIKLHGTFPSHRPFIITDEDYRTFPRLFPPFVNIVQESIMENAFCLLGFSGNDPNFIYWSGWVRDYLGSSRPPIYLCGLLQLTEPQKRLLENRRVIPIDLTSVVSNVDTTDIQLKHRLAIEWFLRYLKNGEPVSRNSWPRRVKQERWDSGFGLPSLELLELEDDFQLDNSPLSPLDDATAAKLCGLWSSQREDYPGWLITPYYKRIGLWRDTEIFSPRIIKALSHLKFPDNLFLAYELNWRAERCLTPIDDDWVVAFQSVIESINPFPQSLSSLSSPNNPASRDHFTLPWDRISHCWVELVFALARNAREYQNGDSFKRWIELLRPIARFQPEWEARWYHEQCTFRFFQFDQNGTLGLLEEWPSHQSSFWEARRAALLAELGQVEKASSIAEQLLNDVRSAMQPYVIDYELLSQEAWLMLQLSMLDRPQGTDTSHKLQQRWDELKAYEIDPWFERNTLQSEIRVIANDSRSGRRETTDFDPMSRTTHFQSGPSLFSRTKNAFSYLRLFEDAALPMRVGSLHMASEEGAIAARLIYPFFPLLALSTMVRSDKNILLSEWFDRVRVASLTQAEVAKFTDLFVKALKEAVNAVSADPRQARHGETFLTRNLETFSELVSRLTFRLSDEDLESLFTLAIDMYKSSAFRQHSFVYRKTTDLLLKRITFALPRAKLLDKLGFLLALPIATEPGHERDNPALVRDPFETLEWPKRLTSNDVFDRTTWTAPISHLINLVRHGTDAARERAIHRLLFVDEVHALSPDETMAFREALWSRLDEVGLPANRSIYLWVLLRYPPPNAADDYRRELQKKILSLSPGDSHYFEELIAATTSPRSSDEDVVRLFTWSEEQAMSLFSQAREWWTNQKAAIEREKQNGVADIYDQRVDSIRQLVEFLGKVVVPNVKAAPSSYKADILGIVNDTETYGYSTLLVQPLLLFIDSERLPEVINRLRIALSSSEEIESRYAVFALYWWLLYSTYDTLPQPPSDLVLELGNKIALRREPALLAAIGQTSLIIDQMPTVLSVSFVELLSRGLEYLLSDTKLPTEKERAELDERHVIVRVEDRPDYRAASTHLAAALYRVLGNKLESCPEVLAKWKEIAETDVLPEVRLAWQEPL